MHNDLDVLRNKIVSLHPGLFWHNTPESVDSLFNGLKTQVNKPLSSIEFYQIAAQANSAIKCVHSDIRPEEAYYKTWKDSAHIIPFGLRRVGGRYLVNQSYTHDVPDGVQIHSINGKSIEEIVVQLLPYIPADGSNLTRKYAALHLSFSKYYSLFIEPNQTTYHITYIQQSDAKKVTIQGISPNQYWQHTDSVRTQHTPRPIALDIRPKDNSAILTVSSFRNDLMNRFGIDYPTMLDQMFKEINRAGVKHLVIDLRNNGGGYSEYGAQLLEHLTDSPFTYCYGMELLTDGSDTTLRYDIPETFKGFPQGLDTTGIPYRWSTHSVLQLRKPADDVFKGSVYFLINGGCVSTTSEVATVAHRLNLGTFIGEEVGGSFVGDCGGIMSWFKLPNSRINVRLALVKYVMAYDSPFGHFGVQPDHKVTPGDGLEANDRVLRYCLDLISR